MKKRILIIGLASALIIGASATALLCSTSKPSQFKASGSYTISFKTDDFIDATSFSNGSFTVKTDQLKNDITFNYENACKTDGGIYLQGNGYGKIYNTIGNEVRGIESILIKSATQRVNVRYGFKEEGVIKYVDEVESEVVDAGGYEFPLNGIQPNYFSIESGQMSDVFISEIVITYPQDCVEHENPYKTKDGIKYFKSSGGNYMVMGFAGASMKNVVIPAEVDGVPVTEILAHAFRTDTTIESVSLPNTLKAIGNGAFRECSKLASVTFATGGTEDLSIYDDVFRETAIVNITFPKRLSYIEPSYALYDTLALESINIEDDYSGGNYKTIDGVLYRNDPYYGVELIHYPANSPYSTLNVPNNVYKIHEYSCENTANLQIVNFNNDNDLLIDSYAFGNNDDNSSITNIYFNGAGVVTLNWNPFRGYKGDLILHEDTIIEDRGLGQMAGNARVFFEATQIQQNWNENWAVSKNLTYGANVTFYLYSESAPANPAPTNIDGFWHYVADVPTLW